MAEKASPSGEKKKGLFGRLAQYGASAMNAVGDGINYIAGVEDADDLEVLDDGSTAKTDENKDERKAMWTQLKGLIGADVMSKFSVPVFIMEPFSTLQKMSEIMQHEELLELAAAEEDPNMRIAYITALAISTYSSNLRTKKPFNPILGETFEMKLKCGATYLSEQVCHHPPISAGHAEAENWTYDITSAVKTKFMGNWVDVWPTGRTRILLKRTGEVFNIIPPASRINNVVVGNMWIDTFGEMRVENLKTGASAKLEFKACSMFGRGRYEVSGNITGADGAHILRVEGKWNTKVGVMPCDPKTGAAAPGSEPKTLWEVRPMPENPTKFGFTQYALECNAAESCPEGGALFSDSRFRPDRAALEIGDNSRAQSAKHELEEQQRAERREREARKEEWAPRWFDKAEDADLTKDELYEGTAVFLWNGKYDGDQGKAAKRAAAGAEPKAVAEGGEFCPWQYPEGTSA